MEIYLVRVANRPEGALYVERKPSATTEDDYIAMTISHVWGMPETISHTYVDGIDDPVALSPGKKDILNILHRRDVCGKGWFWMDLFCIGQRPNAAISISEQLAAIPAIYKSARCVKVLIESPICEAWQTRAADIVSQGIRDRAVFVEEELRHSRKCPNLMFFDPWFERLWTRQEGLYAKKLDIVTLDSVPCARFNSQKHTFAGRWIAEGNASTKRDTAQLFIHDKLAYHGFTAEERDKMVPDAYLDFVYRRKLHVVDWYGGEVGPHSRYSPIAGAWESGRVTTKARDYVLAVFPDMAGYRVPPNPRKMSFEALLTEALSQPALRQRYLFAAKVPKGMLVEGAELSAEDSVSPWMPQQPRNVAQALDGILAPAIERAGAEEDNSQALTMMTPCISLQPISPCKENLFQLLESWTTTTNSVQHASQIHPSGPCIGAHSETPSDRIPLRRYVAEQFASPALEAWGQMDVSHMVLRTDNLTLERVESTPPEDTFNEEFRRFLVCLMCGTTWHTAGDILDAVDFVTIEIPAGSLLALVNSSELARADPSAISLQRTRCWHGQGFMITVTVSSDVYRVIGRTVIPKITTP